MTRATEVSWVEWLNKQRRDLFFILRLVPFVAIFSVLPMIFGCAEKGSGTVSLDLPSSGPIDSVPIGGPAETSGFWVNVRNNQHRSIISSDLGFQTPCFISKEATNNTLLTCYLDILEGDLYNYDISLQYNSPPGLCSAITTQPSWFWNKSSGFGPSRIEVDVTQPESGDPFVTSCEARLASTGALVACSSHPELTDVANPDGPKCVYDTSSRQNGTNCCLGDYIKVTSTTSTGAGGGTTVVETESEWNSGPGACIGGLGQGWNPVTDAGYPARRIQAVGRQNTPENKGLNDAIVLPSNASSTVSSFSTFSNFYTSDGNPHAHAGYESGTSSLPYAFEPIDDLDGSLIRSGSPSYQFRCLDDGLEVLHRIDFYIREWNTLEDYLAYELTEGSTYNPDRDGVEGEDCDYSDIFGDEECNDRFDFDDILEAVGGSYTTDNTDPDAAAIRETYFPNIRY